MCTNSVTWFCAYLCKTEDTMNYACCNIWCTTCGLLWPLSANISESAQVFIFCFWEIFSSILHILKTQLVSMYFQLYFLPPFSHTSDAKLSAASLSGIPQCPGTYIQVKLKSSDKQSWFSWYVHSRLTNLFLILSIMHLQSVKIIAYLKNLILFLLLLTSHDRTCQTASDSMSRLFLWWL